MTENTQSSMQWPPVEPLNIMEVPKHFNPIHFRAITINGRKFTYCPVGNICSWSAEDYDHDWCHFCEKFFSEIRG